MSQCKPLEVARSRLDVNDVFGSVSHCFLAAAPSTDQFAAPTRAPPRILMIYSFVAADVERACLSSEFLNVYRSPKGAEVVAVE